MPRKSGTQSRTEKQATIRFNPEQIDAIRDACLTDASPTYLRSRNDHSFRGVSKHHLQKYLDFLALKLNFPDQWFEKLLCYNVSG